MIMNLPFHARLPRAFMSYVLHALPIAVFNFLLQLVLRKPLEVLVPQLVLLEIDLAGHHTRLKEEGLRALLHQARGKLHGAGEVVLVVADGHVADEPGVDVGPAGLAEDAHCCLLKSLVIEADRSEC